MYNSTAQGVPLRQLQIVDFQNINSSGACVARLDRAIVVPVVKSVKRISLQQGLALLLVNFENRALAVAVAEYRTGVRWSILTMMEWNVRVPPFESYLEVITDTSRDSEPARVRHVCLS